MSFTITNEKDEDLDLLQITDFSSGIQVRVLPEFGAMLHEFSIPSGNRRIQIIDNYKNQGDLRKNISLNYKNVKLSPFVCRISSGKYTFDGQSHEFIKKFKDGSAIHGLLFDKPFTVLAKNAGTEEASVSFRHLYKKENPAYPHEYLINVKYTLKRGGRLYVDTTVENVSPQPIPIADGWHPYFNLEGELNEWLLSFRSKKMVDFDEKQIPVGGYSEFPLFYSARKIGDQFFDNCFLLEPREGIASAVLENPENRLRLSLFPDDHYPFLQIFTPDDRKSIAIENLSSAPDAFNNGLGLTVLKPGDSQSFQILYQLEFV